MNIDIPIWTILLSVVFLCLCFYLTLTFIESLHDGDRRAAEQSKSAAVICFASAFVLPVCVSIFNG